MVRVLVGREQQEFMVHQNEICARSGFFKAACSQQLANPDDTRTVELPGEEICIFDLYLSCLYKNLADVGDTAQSIAGEHVGENFAGLRTEHRLVKSYLLADKLGDVFSANIFIDKLVQHYTSNNYICSAQSAALVANSLASESPLRQLMVDMLSDTTYPSIIQDLCKLDSAPKEFISQILIKKDELSRKGVPPKGRMYRDQPKCTYHQHDELRRVCGDLCMKKGTSDKRT